MLQNENILINKVIGFQLKSQQTIESRSRRRVMALRTSFGFFGSTCFGKFIYWFGSIESARTSDFRGKIRRCHIRVQLAITGSSHIYEFIVGVYAKLQAYTSYGSVSEFRGESSVKPIKISSVVCQKFKTDPQLGTRKSERTLNS